MSGLIISPATVLMPPSAGHLETRKTTLQFEGCVLIPPSAPGVQASTKEKPPGCDTVFVGGIPENVTESVLHEVFTNVAGPIVKIRISHKNYCHIRFEREESVSKALVVSGYRMKIDGRSESAYTGRIHVDFALPKRAVKRRRSGSSSDEDGSLSDHDTQKLGESIKRVESFEKSADILISWLDRGECSKKNCTKFYSMMQTVFLHSKRLLAEKQREDAETEKIRQCHDRKLQSFLVSFGQVERVFVAAGRQKCWDHFTKAQRKNIGAWKSQLTEIRRQHVDTAVSNRKEEEMDLSDSGDELEDAEEVVGRKKESRETDSEEVILIEDHKQKVGHDEWNAGRLLSVLSVFLNSFPDGAEQKTIDSYVRQISHEKVKPEDVLAVLSSAPNVFQKVDAPEKWKYVAL